MENRNFATTIMLDQSPEEVFSAVNNVRAWWSEEIEGNTEKINDEFSYHYLDVHRCKMKLVEVIPARKVVWLVKENYFSFTNDKSEWTGTKIVFNISRKNNKTQLNFTHLGLVPEYECYSACVNGWTQYIEHSLPALIRTGKGHPNTGKKGFTPHEVAARFNELAMQEKWFEIHDELFSDNVSSVEPVNSPWLKDAEGKANVRNKAEDWVKRIEAVHRAYTTAPVIGGNHFAVGREMDITVAGLGRIQINEVMIYEVKDGQIVSEKFFY